MSKNRLTADTALDNLLNRRSLLKGAGTLVFTLKAATSLTGASAQTPVAATATATQTPLEPGPDPSQLDSWIAIGEDGSVTAFYSKLDMGQGTDTGIAQFVADELDVAFEAVTIVMGDTKLTVDGGGASSATGIEEGSWPMRHSAAEARRVLLELGSKKLGVPVDQLSVSNGVITATNDKTKTVSYGDLIGDKHFNIELTWNQSYGNGIDVEGKAKLKTADEFKIVGQPILRTDVKPKIFAKFTYIDKVKVDGMLHGRVLRPPVVGSVPESYDESSIADIPNVQVVQKDGFLGLVAENEWHAVKAASKLDVKWSKVNPPLIEMDTLYDHIRGTAARNTPAGVIANVDTDDGDVDKAFASAAKIIDAEYEWPFMSHACLGPACGIADVKPDSITFWSGTQKPHKTRDGIAALLGRDPETVHGIWVQGPGSYGRNDSDDAAADAALLSEAVGKPVRVQYMRHDAHGWDPKGPAAVITMKAGLDENNKVTAYSFYAKGFSGSDVASNGGKPGDLLAGEFTGAKRTSADEFGVPGEAYGFENKRLSWDNIPPLVWNASPLRTSHIRDPQGPQCTFSSESFIDEIAYQLGVDAVDFRLQYLTDDRHIAVVKAAAEKAGWDTRPSPNPKQDDPNVFKGRGIGYALRKNTIVATVAEVEVNKKTGRVWPRKITVAHDCGLIVNPQALKNTIEGATMQSLSRTLYEEVQFDQNNVTSVDWLTYPIIDITDAPEELNVVMLNHPEDDPTGAGEPATKPVAAAIANAIFDATGVRIRRVPFRPERVLAAIEAAGVKTS